MKLIRILTIAFTVFTVILTIVFFGWWALEDRLMFGSESFNQIKWMHAARNIEQTCERGDMAYDLQQNFLKKGDQREQVLLLLGRPSFEDEISVEYDLGKCMHVYHGLMIFFDQNGRLVRSHIASH